jgi:hypothetical protein
MKKHYYLKLLLLFFLGVFIQAPESPAFDAPASGHHLRIAFTGDLMGQLFACRH